MNLCQRENLYQVDLLSPAQRKITEAEYWLQKRGQKELEDINEQIIADGMNPMETTFQTRKQFVRNAVSEISSSAISFEDFQSQLFEKYKIHVKENRGRYSYLHPEREKYISGRSLGTNFDKDYLLNLFLKLMHLLLSKKKSNDRPCPITMQTRLPFSSFALICVLLWTCRTVLRLNRAELMLKKSKFSIFSRWQRP